MKVRILIDVPGNLLLTNKSKNDPFINTMWRAGSHHGPSSWTMMEDGLFPWSDFIGQLSWFDFLRNLIYKVFWSLTKCKTNMDQEE